MRAQILNASAGSGKTYQLAYKYVHDVIEHPELYRNILAVTFTNKATKEMKSRILQEINCLAAGEKSKYLKDLKASLRLDERTIRQNALTARTKILHDYSRFTVLTIDTFFQRILRAFIKELGLDLNYNIEIETSTILAKSTDSLIEEIASNEELRKWMIGFVQERIEEGEKWDVRGGILSLGGEIFKEKNKQRFALKGKKEDLKEIISQYSSHAQSLLKDWQATGQQALNLMQQNGVSCSDFKGGNSSFAHYFEKAAQGVVVEYSATVWKMAQTDKGWCTKANEGSMADTLSPQLRPLLEKTCKLFDKLISSHNTVMLLRENYRTFALLADLYDKVKQMCEEQNLMLLSESKNILSKFIAENDVPFIYEKAGTRFKRIMIDEFQDTSEQEWQNFLPLLQNAMAESDQTSVFIVGDIKQSIYRWRGGDWKLLHHKAKQALGEDTQVIPLIENRRSLKNVVEFNNVLMMDIVSKDNDSLNHLVNEALCNKKISLEEQQQLHDTLKQAYSSTEQIVKRESISEGYVSVETYSDTPPFIPRICELLDKGFQPKDIMILVRSANDGKKVADQLLAFKQQNDNPKYRFDITTQEALIIGSSPVSGFITAALHLAINPDDKLNAAICNHFLGQDFDKELKAEDREFFLSLRLLSPEEAFEKIVLYFALGEQTQHTAYLQAIHELVHTFSTNKISDIPLYLKWWEEQGANKPLSIEQSPSTIEILTIHKAKGLEKPAVIIPYCSWAIDPKSSTTQSSNFVWAKANDGATAKETNKKEAHLGEFPVNYKKAMADSLFSEDYYREFVYAHVDNINLLYVALTRAKESLHVFIPQKRNYIGGLVQRSLEALSDGEGNAQKGIIRKTPIETGIRYEVGMMCSPEVEKQVVNEEQQIILDTYPTAEAQLALHLNSERYLESTSVQKVSNPSKDAELPFEESTSDIKVEMEEKAPRKFGILMHRLFQDAQSEEDIQKSLHEMMLDSILSEKEEAELGEKIQETFKNPLVKEWFSTKWDSVRNECDIIRPKMWNQRPDRVMIQGKRAVVVDYKFGLHSLPSYHKQMKQYLKLMREMGYTTTEGYLWYVLKGEIEKIEDVTP